MHTATIRISDLKNQAAYEVQLDLRDTSTLTLSEPIFGEVATAAPLARGIGRTRNADGTVTDHATGLQWSATLLAGGEPTRYTYAQAETAVKALGDGWRLPTRRELLDLVDDTRHEPAIDTDLFPDTQSNWYWSSTPTAWSSDCAWFVLFGHGNSDYGLRGHDAFVRAVRSVSSGQ